MCLDAKCYICQFNGTEFEGEAGYYSEGKIASYCKKGCYEQFENGGTTCEKFSEVFRMCAHCKRIVSITSLKHGFCSSKCESEHKKEVAQSIIKDEKRLLEISQIIESQLQPLDVMIKFKGEVYILEYYLEENKQMLKTLEALTRRDH
jgi:hypothetical protein